MWDPRKNRYLLQCREDLAGGGGLGEHRGIRIMEHAKGNDLKGARLGIDPGRDHSS